MSTASAAYPIRRRRPIIDSLNGQYHGLVLNLFMIIVIAHWAEHVVQAFQIWVLDWPRPAAKGVLGEWFPWLVTSEWLHYGYALIMLIGLIVLRHGFHGAARSWWNLALVIQVWHHFEHLLLLIQATTKTYFFGGSVPTSVAQTLFPRVELHLFYNAIVTVPMIVAIVLHRRAQRRLQDRESARKNAIGVTDRTNPAR